MIRLRPGLSTMESSSSWGCNTYLVEDEDRVVLVDPGPKFQLDRLARELRAAGRSPYDVTDVLLTHYDQDHSRSAAEGHRRTGATVYLGADDAQILRSSRVPGSWQRRFMMRLLGLAELPEGTVELRGEVAITPGLTALPSPGHTPGHYAFLWRDVALIGDAANCGPDGELVPFDRALMTDPAQADATREMLSSLPVRLFCAAHSDPVERGGSHEADPDRGTRRAVRRFERFLDRNSGPLLERFGAAEVAAMRPEMVQEYRTLLPQLPAIGGRRNPLSGNLVKAVPFLAVHRVVQRHGGGAEVAGKVAYDYARRIVGRIPRPVLTTLLAPRLKRSARAVRWTQQHHYPGDWAGEMVDGTGQQFDFGVDWTACGVVAFLHAQGADELTPYLCHLDYVFAEAAGAQLTRTKTLAWGCDRCDFRWTVPGTSTATWPPEFPERACGRPAGEFDAGSTGMKQAVEA